MWETNFLQGAVVRNFYQSSLGLEGSFLIAHPNLLDANFRRTVLLMSSYEPGDGATGLILNRAADRVVQEVVDERELGPLANIPVFFGGPVARDRLTFASFHWRVEAQVLDYRTNLELDEARRLALEPDVIVRGFVGYSGWTPGQLEKELEQKAWLVQMADRGVLDLAQCRELWFSIMQEYGPWFRLLAVAPDDPSFN